MSIYPNPSSGQSILAYHLPSATKGEVDIFDSLGRLYDSHTIEEEEGSLTLSGYSPGIYFAVMSADGRIIKTAKFVRL